jgi:hypothetical protein
LKEFLLGCKIPVSHELHKSKEEETSRAALAVQTVSNVELFLLHCNVMLFLAHSDFLSQPIKAYPVIVKYIATDQRLGGCLIR